QNQLRKAIQNKVTALGMEIAQQQLKDGRYGLCIYLTEGHAGVHGISASRIKEAFGRPTVFLADKHGEEGIITGSIRGIDKFHVGNAIQWIIATDATILLAGGGHSGAGGVS